MNASCHICMTNIGWISLGLASPVRVWMWAGLLLPSPSPSPFLYVCYICVPHCCESINELVPMKLTKIFGFQLPSDAKLREYKKQKRIGKQHKTTGENDTSKKKRKDMVYTTGTRPRTHHWVSPRFSSLFLFPSVPFSCLLFSSFASHRCRACWVHPNICEELSQFVIWHRVLFLSCTTILIEYFVDFISIHLAAAAVARPTHVLGGVIVVLIQSRLKMPTMTRKERGSNLITGKENKEKETRERKRERKR